MFKEPFQKLISTQLVERNILIEKRYFIASTNQSFLYCFMCTSTKQHLTLLIYKTNLMWTICDRSCVLLTDRILSQKSLSSSWDKITQSNFSCIIVFSVLTLVSDSWLHVKREQSFVYARMSSVGYGPKVHSFESRILFFGRTVVM